MGEWPRKRERSTYTLGKVVVVVEELDDKGLLFSLLGVALKNELTHWGSMN